MLELLRCQIGALLENDFRKTVHIEKFMTLCHIPQVTVKTHTLSLNAAGRPANCDNLVGHVEIGCLSFVGWRGLLLFLQDLPQ